MTSIERETIKQWWFDKISDDEFKKKNKEIENKKEIMGYIIKNIEKFISQKKEEGIDEFITQNKHKEIREYALKQLKRNDFTNKDVKN